jgi:hypothetical protein
MEQCGVADGIRARSTLGQWTGPERVLGIDIERVSDCVEGEGWELCVSLFCISPGRSPATAGPRAGTS